MASYVDNVLSFVDKLPGTTKELLSTIRDLDSLIQSISDNTGADTGLKLLTEKSSSSIQVLEELSDRKALLAYQTHHILNHHLKIVEEEIKHLNATIAQYGQNIIPEGTIKADEERIHMGRNINLKKRNRPSVIETTATKENSDLIYCFCRKVAHGDMVACDNKDCIIEWFHYSCVSLTKKPKNEWLCADCIEKRRKM